MVEKEAMTRPVRFERVLLLGSGEFTDQSDPLPQLPAVPRNIASLRYLFSSSRFEMYPDAVREITAGAADPRKVREAIAEAITQNRTPEGALLVYFAGHGFIDDGDRLLLAVTPDDTTKVPGYPASELLRPVVESNFLLKIIILDCCNAGHELHTLLRKPVQSEPGGVGGTYAVAAVAADTAAMAPGDSRHTAFTGALIEILEIGLGTGRPHLGLSEVFENVRARTRNMAGRRTVHIISDIAAPDPAFSHNPRYRQLTFDRSGPAPAADIRLMAVDARLTEILRAIRGRSVPWSTRAVLAALADLREAVDDHDRDVVLDVRPQTINSRDLHAAIDDLDGVVIRYQEVQRDYTRWQRQRRLGQSTSSLQDLDDQTAVMVARRRAVAGGISDLQRQLQSQLRGAEPAGREDWHPS